MVTKDNPISSEHDNSDFNRFESAINRLSSRDIETVELLRATDIDLLYIRKKLEMAGLNLNLSETEIASINKYQFRTLDEGRGIGVKAALGEERARELIEWCYTRSKTGPRLKKDKTDSVPGTQGRGLRQLSADIIALSVDPEITEDKIDAFCRRTNQRVIKGFIWENRGNKEAKNLINEKFAQVPKPEKIFSSIPPGSAANLWEFLTKSNS